jgi:hypothetical protein
MKNATHDNDNLPLLVRHPRLAKAHERGCSLVLSERKVSIDAPRGSDVSRASLLGRVENANVGSLSVDPNLGPEPAGSRINGHALEPGSVPFADGTVSLVLSGSSDAQVGDAIIRPVTVDVIDLIGRPLAVDVEPREPVSAVVLPTDHDQSVSGASSSCDITDLALRAERPNAPPKLTGCGVVIQKVSKFSGGNHLAKTHKSYSDCERSPESKSEKNSEEDTGRELALINFRIEALNWIEFMLSKKRAVANDSQVRLAGRNAS